MHVVLIPAYEPDERLVALVRALVPRSPVVVVDDGSGPAYAPFFAAAAAAGATLTGHALNRGKGATLREGFAFITAAWPGAHVVTADADGQHTPDDIARVAAALPHAARAGSRHATSPGIDPRVATRRDDSG
ncbi:MAG TPA: glycosyltransferase, partial [Microbacterium sp.]|nr:glycosyltransferase [Microbacterium sp.]